MNAVENPWTQQGRLWKLPLSSKSHTEILPEGCYIAAYQLVRGPTRSARPATG